MKTKTPAYKPDLIERHPVASGLVTAVLFVVSIRVLAELLVWLKGGI